MRNFVCLLIDDDIDDQEIFCTVLDSISPGCNCITATNGRVALEMLMAGKVSPSVIFLDLNMPLMNGRQFLHEMTRMKIFQDVPVIVLTTSSDVQTKTEILESGASAFITKPDKFSEWEFVLQRALENFL